MTLDWTKPRSDGGSALTGYVIERRDPASSYWTRVGSVDHRRTTYVVANLRPGAEYQLQVLAENDIGVSDPCTLAAPVRLPALPAAAARTLDTLIISQILKFRENRTLGVTVVELARRRYSSDYRVTASCL